MEISVQKPKNPHNSLLILIFFLPLHAQLTTCVCEVFHISQKTSQKTSQKAMSQKEQIQLFEQKKVRTVWDDEKEEWYFSVVDVVEVLTDSADPTDYLKKMRKREPELGIYIGTNCPQVTMTTFHQSTVGTHCQKKRMRTKTNKLYKTIKRHFVRYI